MVSRVYVFLIGLAGVLVSVTGAYFSVTGLVHLFSGSSSSVATMAASLEFSKFVLVGFVYRYWGHIHRPLRAYLIFSVTVLMMITSIGIYGYLSDAYQIASLDLHARQLEIDALTERNQRVEKQIVELQTFIDKIPASRISRKFEFQKTYLPKIEALRNESSHMMDTITNKKQELLKMDTKVGPIVYLAKALNTNIDNAVKYFILVFVSVFDPLAVSLIFCLNLLIRIREKYHGDESKIGARALVNTVDHRFKKVS